MNGILGNTVWNYDPLNRITATIDALNRQLKYEYDAVGNTTKLIYPDTRSVTYNYYKNNWLNTFTDPENLTTNYVRDGVGNLITEKKSNETTSSYAYDKVDRIKSIVNKQDTDAKKTNSQFEYTYNNVGERTSIKASYDTNNGSDAVKKVQKTDYTYDPLRRLVESKDNGGVFQQYTYDAVGNRLSFKSNDDTNPNGNSPQFNKSKSEVLSQNYTYNSDNELLSIIQNVESGGKNISDKSKSDKLTDSINRFLTELNSDKKNASKKSSDALNLLVNNFVADLATKDLTSDETSAQIKAIRDELAKGLASKDINPSVGNKLNKILDEVEGLNQSTKNQVISEFSYDANGNRVNTQNYVNKNHKITGTDYTYDSENRLVKALDYVNVGNNNSKRINHGETTLAYDGIGRRLTQSFDHKSNDSQTDTIFNIPGNANNGKSLNSDPIDEDQKRIEFVFNGLDPIAQYTQDAKKHINLYRGEKNRIEISNQFMGSAGDNGNADNAHKFWFDYDALNSVVGITKQKGQADKSYLYEDFGDIENKNKKDSQLQGVNKKNPYTYTGQYINSNMGLYEFYSRAYDPSTGVWLQQDKYRGAIIDPQSLHRYAYVKNSPINYFDYLGFFDFTEYNVQHLAVQVYFQTFIRPGAKIEVTIKGASSKGNGNVGYADIVWKNPTTGINEIWEVKHFNTNETYRARFQEQLGRYIDNYYGTYGEKATEGEYCEKFTVPYTDSDEIIVESDKRTPGILYYYSRYKEGYPKPKVEEKSVQDKMRDELSDYYRKAYPSIWDYGPDLAKRAIFPASVAAETIPILAFGVLLLGLETIR